MATSPTQNSLKFYRALGYECQVVEHWNPFARIRKDLFDVIDIVGMRAGEIVGIQCTSGNNHSARKNKILESGLAKLWVSAGGKLILQSWKKNKNRWEARTEQIILEMWE